ncbi:Secreted protein [Pseudomonas sp. IT-P218]
MNMALVGAGLLAMNDNAVHQTGRGACIASKPAPTGISAEVWNHG